MAGEIENLIVSASVLDDFSDTLDEFEQDLYKLDGVAESIFPIDAEMRIGEALRDIAKLKAALGTIDDDVDVDADMNSLLRGEADELNIFDQPGGQMGRRDALGIFQGARNRPSSASEWRRILFGAGAAGVDLGDLPAFGVGGPFMGEERDQRGLGGRLRELARDFSRLKFTMGGFMTLLANLAPLLGVFVGALPAAIAGVAALGAAAIAAAGALYGVLGLGVMGLATTGGEWDFDRLRNRVQGLIDDFLMAFSPLADAFIPIMEEGITMLSQLFFDVARSAQLALSLTDDLRWLMRFVADAAPGATAGLAAFAEAAMPFMQAMINELAAIDWFRLFADIIAETAPFLVSMTAAIGRALPAIYNMSIGFLAMATALIEVVTRIIQLIGLHPLLARGFGLLISIILVAVAVTGLYTVAMGSVFTQAIRLAAQALPALIIELHSLIAAKIGATLATITLTAAIAGLLGLVTFGIIPAISTAAGGFGTLSGNIMSATEAMRQFNREGARVSGFSPGATASGAGGPRYSRPGSATVVAPDKETGNAVANRLSFGERTSDTVSSSDDANNLHSG